MPVFYKKDIEAGENPLLGFIDALNTCHNTYQTVQTVLRVLPVHNQGFLGSDSLACICNFESADQCFKHAGLTGQLLACCCTFLCRRRVVLHYAGNLIQSLCDLVGCLRLFCRSRRNSFNRCHYLIRCLYGFIQNLCRIRCQCTATLHGRDRIFNQLLRILRGLRRFACKASYLIGYNSKSLSSRSCAGGFYRCIQSKNIGLERNIINGFDNSLNLMRGLLDFIHCCHEFLHFLLAFIDFGSVSMVKLLAESVSFAF